MTALSPSDIADLDQEIAEVREQIQHLKGSLRRPWNEQQATKMRYQLDAARRHRDRLEKVRATG